MYYLKKRLLPCLFIVISILNFYSLQAKGIQTSVFIDKTASSFSDNSSLYILTQRQVAQLLISADVTANSTDCCQLPYNVNIPKKQNDKGNNF